MRYIKIVGLVAVAALSVMLVAAACSQPAAPDYRLQALQYEATATAVARASEQAAALAPVQTAAAALWLVLPLLALTALLTVLVLYFYRRTMQAGELVQASQPVAGQLPVSRRLVLAGHYDGEQRGVLAGHYTAAVAASSRPMVATVPTHYSPTITYQQQVAKGLTAPADALALAAPADVPTFADLLATGLIGPGRPMQLGYTDGQPLNGGLRDVYSSLLTGLSGSGKTTTLRYLACQSVLQGARLIVLDPHAGAGDDSLADTLAPLAPAYLVAPPTTPAGMVDAIQLARNILQQRLAGDRDRRPIICVVDEYTALIARSGVGDHLAALLEAILQEGRKVGVIALCAAQVPKGTRTGGSEVRDSFTSTYVHRTRRNFARMVTDDPEDAKTASDLPTGMALLRRTNGETTLVSIPLTTAADVQEVGRLLAAPVPPVDVAGYTLQRGRPASLDGEGRADGDEPGEQPAAHLAAQPAAHLASTPDPRVERVKQMFLAGASQNDIVQEVWGGGKKLTGQPKITAHDELNAILRGLLAAGR